MNLPSPLLKPGFHTLSVMIGRPKTDPIVSLENVLRFEVQMDTTPDFDCAFTKERRGLITVNPKWYIK